MGKYIRAKTDGVMIWQVHTVF